MKSEYNFSRGGDKGITSKPMRYQKTYPPIQDATFQKENIL
jgi:hypothetical protein